ncbi:MAG: hypothetical protein IEMM0002_0862 [bacterium]|nr:MAG: hypothetical protein IEMM0002_0862 [bacterium]
MCRGSFTVLFLIALLFPLTVHADELDELEKRVKTLEMKLKNNVAAAEDIEFKLADLINISGYLDAEYRTSDKPGSIDHFRLHHMSMFMERRLNEQWSFFSEIEYEDAPFFEGPENTGGELKKAQGRIFVEAVYMDYRPSHKISVRAGRFYTPAGIWNVYHYSPFVPTQIIPAHIRKIFPQVTDGMSLYGDLDMGGNVLSYNIYTGNGEGNSGNGDKNNAKSIGGRLLLAVPGNHDFEIGVSVYNDEFKGGKKKQASGFDMQFHFNRFRFQGEYASAAYDTVSRPSYASSGYYGQLIYRLVKWSFMYRYDYYEPSDTVVGDKLLANSFAVNYHWSPVIVSKIEYHMNDVETPDEDYNEMIFSTAMFF